MIRSFRHKGLRALYEDDDARKVRPNLAERCRVRLSVLHSARTLGDLNLPGHGFHALHGVPKRYALKINGPWRITFEWENGDAWRVDLEQYH